MDKILCSWFKGKQLAFAFSLPLGLGRGSASLNSYLTPKLLENDYSIFFAFFLGTLVCILSWLASLGYVILEKYACSQEDQSITKKPVTFCTIFKFPAKYWILLLSSGFLYGAFHPFFNISVKFIQIQYSCSEAIAGTLMMVPYIITGVFTPLHGWITDIFGRRLHNLFCGCLLLIGVNLFFLFVNSTNPYIALIPLIGFGLFCGILESTIWPILAIIFDEDVLGIAFSGLAISNNIFLAFIPMLNGWLHDIRSTKDQDDYTLVIYNMIIQTFIGMGLLYFLFKLDGGAEGDISRKSKEEKQTNEYQQIEDQN